MRKNKKIILLLSTLISFQLFAPTNTSKAKSILINYDLAEGVNVREKQSFADDSKILGGIDYPDFYEIKQRLKNPVIFDGRNQYNANIMKEYGFKYFQIGVKDEY